jgi:comEA protein
VKRLTKTEAACLAAAAVFLAAAAGVRLFAAGGESAVRLSPADRTESVWSDAPAEAPALPDGADIDINSADAETLAQLPGIGGILAERIIRYREENGAFQQISDIMAVDGIGQATFIKIKDYITAEETP